MPCIEEMLVPENLKQAQFEDYLELLPPPHLRPPSPLKKEEKIYNPIIFRQFIYIRRLNPLKAYALKYKYFEAGGQPDGTRVFMSEYELCQHLIKE